MPPFAPISDTAICGVQPTLPVEMPRSGGHLVHLSQVTVCSRGKWQVRPCWTLCGSSHILSPSQPGSNSLSATSLLWDFRQVLSPLPTSAFSSRKQYQHHRATVRIKWEATFECTVLCSQNRQDLPEVQRQVSDGPRCVQLQSPCSFHCSPVFHQETHHIPRTKSSIFRPVMGGA